ncbi:hypothetical protein B0H14DRAFT_2603464 [Mycena olivaceomarginata]|nr:hypothetical protein B0H14DRAFT_2603464 [Mycena olivaceomarginata]
MSMVGLSYLSQALQCTQGSTKCYEAFHTPLCLPIAPAPHVIEMSFEIVQDITGIPFSQSRGVSDSYRWRLSLRSDVYAYGMTVLEILTHEQPYNNIKHTTEVVIRSAKGEHPPRPRDVRVVQRGLDDNVWALLGRLGVRDAHDVVVAILDRALGRPYEALHLTVAHLTPPPTVELLLRPSGEPQRLEGSVLGKDDRRDWEAPAPRGPHTPGGLAPSPMRSQRERPHAPPPRRLERFNPDKTVLHPLGTNSERELDANFPQPNAKLRFGGSKRQSPSVTLVWTALPENDVKYQPPLAVVPTAPAASRTYLPCSFWTLP